MIDNSKQAMPHSMESLQLSTMEASNLSSGSSSEVLNDIHRKEKNIAVYNRSILSLGSDIDQLLACGIELKLQGSVEEIKEELHVLLADKSISPSFIKDATYLLDSFREVSQAQDFRLMLATVNSNMCRKFHTDINTIRMLCTYAGPGTEWLSDDVTEQIQSQHHGRKGDVIVDESFIYRVGTGDVVILKGALYPEGNPIMHRSPSIELSGGKRLLLRIDVNENPWA